MSRNSPPSSPGRCLIHSNLSPLGIGNIDSEEKTDRTPCNNSVSLGRRGGREELITTSKEGPFPCRGGGRYAVGKFALVSTSASGCTSGRRIRRRRCLGGGVVDESSSSPERAAIGLAAALVGALVGAT